MPLHHTQLTDQSMEFCQSNLYLDSKAIEESIRNGHKKLIERRNSMGRLPECKNPPKCPPKKAKIFDVYGVPSVIDCSSEIFESQTMGDVLDDSNKDFEFTAWQEWHSKWSTKIKIRLAKFIKWILKN